ncbi:MAG: hydrogenase maturation protease [Anaerolineales bacterium]|nr:hydrogenase maturation protease [Anaerolineales bacterium]
MSSIIIGYGNPFRRDDGFGWRVIDALRATLDAETEGEMALLQTHQLMPELAEDISRVACVVFVDASVEGEPGEIRTRRVGVGERPAANYTHYVAPEELLGMAEILYGHQPEAWLVTVTGVDFDLGEGLTEGVDRAVGEVVGKIRGGNVVFL